MNQIRRTVASKIEENRAALALVGGFSLLTAAIYYRGKSEGQVNIWIHPDLYGNIVQTTDK